MERAGAAVSNNDALDEAGLYTPLSLPLQLETDNEWRTDAMIMVRNRSASMKFCRKHDS